MSAAWIVVCVIVLVGALIVGAATAWGWLFYQRRRAVSRPSPLSPETPRPPTPGPAAPRSLRPASPPLRGPEGVLYVVLTGAHGDTRRVKIPRRLRRPMLEFEGQMYRCGHYDGTDWVYHWVRSA